VRVVVEGTASASAAQARPAAKGRRPWLRRSLVALVLVLVVGGLVAWAVARLGTWLVVADPLEPSRAVVVLSGYMPYRAMEAAKIYREGWAAEVWLTEWSQTRRRADLARLGISMPREDEYSHEVLRRSGVPDGSIHLLDGAVVNTVDEIHVIARQLARVGGERVIIVTSPPHTRRVRASWRAIVGESPHAIVRPSTSERYDGAHWWRHTSDALAVSREVFGLMNVWAGFPVQPR
jgi:uncharacterized SAM-binding protein YcdF (DUF218 family)